SIGAASPMSCVKRARIGAERCARDPPSHGGNMLRRSFNPIALLALLSVAAASQGQGARQDEVPVTIKELDVEGAIREFQDFQRRLGEYREGIGEGRAIAQETSQILAELRASATAEND